MKLERSHNDPGCHFIGEFAIDPVELRLRSLIRADELGARIEDIRILQGDSAVVAHGTATYAAGAQSGWRRGHAGVAAARGKTPL